MKAVSFSGLQLYKNCPSAFKRRYIDKEKVTSDGPPSPAAMRGSQIHDAIEKFLNEGTDEVPEACAHLENFLKVLQEGNAVPEVRWAMDEKWGPVSFMDKEAKIRGILDALLVKDNIGFVYEWKTGKRYAEHDQQRALYGLAALCLFPHLAEVTVITTYIDLGENDLSTFDREQVRGYQWLWETRVSEVWSDDEYLETPSWRCKYCSYNKDNGGLCGAGEGR